MNIALLLEALRSNHHSGFGIDTAAGREFPSGYQASRRHEQRQSGVAVFIIPGLYWGPAWWDPAYSRLCWKKIRPCRGCAENWIFVC